jgi:glycosyltransferase involved in cell wall biosynthesis
MALRLDADVKDQFPYYMTMIDKVRCMADEFDIIHFHIDYFQFPLFRDIANKTVTTLHSRQDVSDLKTLYAAFPEMPLVSISNAQRRPVASSNFAGTVHHGLPTTLHAPNLKPDGDYVAFLGRVSPEKRLDRAIRIACAAGIPIRIAAKVDKADRDYYEQEIKPMLSLPGVEFIGEINERQKPEFLGNARAMLFPIDWPEPFGIVMIESMACGTPVLAFRNGSVPEVIDDGISGFIVDSEEEAVSVLQRTVNMDRRQVRRRFEERFSATRMAEDYVEIYNKLLTQEQRLPRRISTLRPRVGRDEQRMN